MNLIEAQCPRCQNWIEAPPEMAGQEVECPFCREEIDSKGKMLPPIRKVIEWICAMAIAGMIAVPVLQYYREYEAGDRGDKRFEDRMDGNYVHTTNPLYESAVSGVRGKLVSPRTAVFEKLLSVRRSEIRENILYTRVEVDSQNVFGAMVRSEWGIVLREYRDRGRLDWYAKEVVQLSGPKNVRR